MRRKIKGASYEIVQDLGMLYLTLYDFGNPNTPTNNTEPRRTLNLNIPWGKRSETRWNYLVLSKNSVGVQYEIPQQAEYCRQKVKQVKSTMDHLSSNLKPGIKRIQR